MTPREMHKAIIKKWKEEAKQCYKKTSTEKNEKSVKLGKDIIQEKHQPKKKKKKE